MPNVTVSVWELDEFGPAANVIIEKIGGSYGGKIGPVYYGAIISPATSLRPVISEANFDALAVVKMWNSLILGLRQMHHSRISRRLTATISQTKS